MAASIPNPLLSVNKSADSLNVLLHPLALLTISDYITRHTIRRQKGPIIGAILGQQNGLQVSLEHAFECKLTSPSEGESPPMVDAQWFVERLQQFRDVLKAPPLDLVGWFTIVPTSGPQDVHLPFHQVFLQENESSVLLGFHPEEASNDSYRGGKLPLTIYESLYETASSIGKDDAKRHVSGSAEMMDVEGLTTKFRELTYTFETGEAERIGIEFVAKGGGNAAAVEGAEPRPDDNGKGKSKQKDASKVPEESLQLSPEDEELISSLNARINAIRMLHSRIRLLQTYLSRLPKSYLTNTSSAVLPASSVSDHPDPTAEIDYTILRSIQGLLARLPLIIPAESTLFAQEVVAEKNDVSLVTLLGCMTQSVKDIRETGKTFAILESAIKTKRQAKKNVDSNFAGDEFSSNLEHSGSMVW